MAISSNTTGYRPGVCTSTSRPSSPYTGQTIFETDTNRMYVWNGTAWVIPNSPAQNPTGLELIKTQTIGTAVTSVVVSDVFSATYDNYLIMGFGGASGGDTNLRLQLGSSVTGYYGFMPYGSYSSTTVSGSNDSNTSQFNHVGGADTGSIRINATLFGPYIAKPTDIQSFARYSTVYGTYVGHHNVSTSYTSFTISVGGSNLTGGTIRVYGYRNS